MKYKEFEEALARLEKIVEQLEKGDLALEASMKLFEEGIQISRFCTSKLEEAERKVEILLQSSKGQQRTAPFAAPQDDEADPSIQEGDLT